MRKASRKSIFFSIILSFLIIKNHLNGMTNTLNIPVAEKRIEFELEVTDSIKVDPVHLDFGNILKNNQDIQTATSYYLLSSTYNDDMFIKTSFREGEKAQEYTKIKVPKKQNGLEKDYIDVYLKNLENRILPSGEYKVPIMGEIRGVGDISLGEYEKTVVMDVEITPVSPTIR